MYDLYNVQREETASVTQKKQSMKYYVTHNLSCDEKLYILYITFSLSYTLVSTNNIRIITIAYNFLKINKSFFLWDVGAARYLQVEPTNLQYLCIAFPYIPYPCTRLGVQDYALP